MSDVASREESMRLSRFEFLLMNNPVRRYLQENYEFRIFKELIKACNVNLNNKVIMDAGCGSGYSSELITKTYCPQKVIAFDIMPEQIALARKRKINVDFFVGDVTNINIPDNTCDAVFVFGILHHIPEWRKALKEIDRVLKAGGVALIEEPRHLFDWAELEEGIRMAKLNILQMKKFYLGYFRGYICQKVQ